MPALTLVYLFIVLCHRTLGAWQFGNRYLVDVMPWMFFGILCHQPEEQEDRFARWTLPLAVWGFAINLIGTVAAYRSWF